MAHHGKRTARLAGALWLIVIVAGVLSVVTQSRLPRVAFAANQCYLGVTVLLYEIFKPVATSLSRFAAFCGLAGVASGAALSLVRSDPPTQGFTVAMMFFGTQIIAIGYLIMRSSLIPRILGALLLLGGASYVINSFAHFLAPALGAQLMPFIVPIAIVGEGALTFWLLVKGANVPEVSR